MRVKIIFLLILTCSLSSCQFDYISEVNGSFSGNFSDYYWFETVSENKDFFVIGLDRTFTPVIEIQTKNLAIAPTIVGNKLIVPDQMDKATQGWSDRINILNNKLELEKTFTVKDLDMAGTCYVIDDSRVFIAAHSATRAGAKSIILNTDTYEYTEHYLTTIMSNQKASAGVWDNQLLISDIPAGGAYNPYSSDTDIKAQMLMINLTTREESTTNIYHKDHLNDAADILIEGKYLYMLFKFDRVVERWNLETDTLEQRVDISELAGIEGPDILRQAFISELWDYGEKLAIIYFDFRESVGDTALYKYVVINKSDFSLDRIVDFTGKVPPKPIINELSGDYVISLDEGGILNLKTGEVVAAPGTYSSVK